MCVPLLSCHLSSLISHASSPHVVSLHPSFLPPLPFPSPLDSCCNEPINWSNTAVATGRVGGRGDVRAKEGRGVEPDREGDEGRKRRERGGGEQGKDSFLQTGEEIWLQLERRQSTRGETEEEEVQKWRKRDGERQEGEGHQGEEAP